MNIIITISIPLTSLKYEYKPIIKKSTNLLDSMLYYMFTYLYIKHYTQP